MLNSVQTIEVKPTQRSGMFDSAVRNVVNYCLSATPVTFHVLKESWEADNLLVGKKAVVRRYPYLSLSFKHYPFLTVFMHIVNWSSVILFIQYLITGQPVVHPAILLWAIAGFGGMTVVLWKAATEIEQHRK